MLKAISQVMSKKIANKKTIDKVRAQSKNREQFLSALISVLEEEAEDFRENECMVNERCEPFSLRWRYSWIQYHEMVDRIDQIRGL